MSGREAGGISAMISIYLCVSLSPWLIQERFKQSNQPKQKAMVNQARPRAQVDGQGEVGLRLGTGESWGSGSSWEWWEELSFLGICARIPSFPVVSLKEPLLGWDMPGFSKNPAFSGRHLVELRKEEGWAGSKIFLLRVFGV